MKEEIWKKIPEFSLYEASSEGRIKTFNWKGSGREAIMKPAKDGSGYLRTMLKGENGIIRTIKVHRIIAKTFLLNPDELSEVNHINGIRDDNRLENLEWVSHSQNLKHSFAMGLSSNVGAKNPFSKLTEIEVLEIRAKFKKRVYTREMLAKEFNVAAGTIKGVILRKSWNHV